jgi:hypothetical protein
MTKPEYLKPHKIFKFITAIGESILGIPFVGGILIVSTFWIPLAIMFVLHLISLIFCSEDRKDRSGNLTGLAACLFGWIPVIGMMLHITSASMLWIDFMNNGKDYFSE